MSRINELDELRKQFDSFAEQGYESIFVSQYHLAYEEFLSSLNLIEYRQVKEIVDIGCGDGWTAICLNNVLKNQRGRQTSQQHSIIKYLGIDNSANAISALRKINQLEFLDVTGIVGSATMLSDTGFMESSVKPIVASPELLICNAAVHQITKTGISESELLCSITQSWDRKPMIIIGDYFYPADCTASDVQTSRDWIKSTTGQSPSERSVFAEPEKLADIMRNLGYQRTHHNEVAANEVICLRYCCQHFTPH